MILELPGYVQAAIRCGPVPVLRNVDWVFENEPETLTLGEQVIAFAHQHLVVPEGMHVGEPLRLTVSQQAFILAVVDNPDGTREAVLSVAKRNGKTFVMAVLILAYLIGPLSEQNITVASAAMSRDQAALIFRLMVKMISVSPSLESFLHVIPSSKRIVSLPTGSEYFAMSADAKTGHGRALKLVVLDESGQIRGETDPYVEMLETSQGSYDDSLFVSMSTQAPSDLDWLSITIDDAVRSGAKTSVVHLYEADKDCDLMDESQWLKSNPGLGVFRSEDDLRRQLERAKRLPAKEAGARNLLLNQRISQVSLWLAPSPWKACSGEVNLEVFRKAKRVSVGIDLSSRLDLTAAVFAAADETKTVHLLPYCYTPQQGLEERSRRDRTPYDAWVRDGKLVALPGASIEYEDVAGHLKMVSEELGFIVSTIEYDRWNWRYFWAAAQKVGFAPKVEPTPVGQGYQSFSPRIACFESLLVEGRLRHGGHPLLTMAAANAIAVQDPAGNKKLDKSKSTARIDPIVAAVMATFPVSEGLEETRVSIYEDASRSLIM